ncbi:unnamed protein product [Cladocopium goreaui]|uniref:Uncharacterized protein n=1 Tax=Cladocopium goreaui TaxID=2562237 RepID=A0A9P1FKL9_9DINO|nr:unnamed protein product [Cladocopium goreaui]
MARSPRELTLLLALVTLGIVGLCIFLVNFDSEPIAGPPAWRFSVTLARVRAKAKETRIPQQLILTSKDGLMANLPLAVQRNVRHTMALNPWVRVRWFGDEDCKRYLLQHFNDTELPHFFSQEQRR